MASAAEVIANLLNAQKSTGPTSPEGKKRSSMNAVRHGFTGQLVVVSDAEMPIYQKHCKEYHADFSPKGKLEVDLTQEIADLRWSMSRIRAYETNLCAVQAVALDSGLETGDPDINSALEIANSLEKHMKTLALMSIYEQRKQRAFEKALARLQELQKDRKAREDRDARQAAPFRETFQNDEPDWQPSHDGFVCSNSQIDRWNRRRERAEIVRAAQQGELDPRDRDQNGDENSRDSR